MGAEAPSEPAGETKSCSPRTKSKRKCFFFNEINPCGICEMPCGREIRLRRVKSLRR